MLQNQIALITGASRGIGQAIALKLGKDGATVVGSATTVEGAKSISCYLNEAGIQGMGMMLNVNDADQIGDVLAETRKKFGEITILVNNAGITRDNLLVRMKDEEWDEIMQASERREKADLDSAIAEDRMKSFEKEMTDQREKILVGVTKECMRRCYITNLNFWRPGGKSIFEREKRCIEKNKGGVEKQI